MSSESSDTIEVGNVITIEPGIYLPGVGGVRIDVHSIGEAAPQVIRNGQWVLARVAFSN